MAADLNATITASVDCPDASAIVPTTLTIIIIRYNQISFLNLLFIAVPLILSIDINESLDGFQALHNLNEPAWMQCIRAG
jgi:hypothetical protein